MIIKCTVANIEGKVSHQTFGITTKGTQVTCKVGAKSAKVLKISGGAQEKKLFKKNFNFNELGIGGLDKQFDTIFRRAFNSRRYSPEDIEAYGIKHVKGLLLHGPPGTGKTLIARKIAAALESVEPKIVNGPEIFDKFVGEAERKIRELFKDAEDD